jgi:DNA-binding NarL/FixJ family response regulator
MSSEVARRVVDLFRDYRPHKHTCHHLSPQEHRLRELLGEGHHYKTAAEEMGISLHNLKFYMRQVYEKLQVRSKSEAVGRGLREGLIR